MKAAAVLALFFAAALIPACGPDDELDADTAGDPAADEPGTAAADEPIGDDFAAPDPAPPGCGDDCDDIPDNPRIEIVHPLVVPDEEGDGPVTPMALSGPIVGSHMVTKRYAGFHVHASTGSALLSVAPHGGVADDALHPNRNPSGTIPAGHTVTVVQVAPHNGYMKVRYGGVVGWIQTSKLLWRNPSLTKVKFAMQSTTARNAFFKHQILRSRWNKDGPLHSGNCAPTSLAMGAEVMGAESSGLSIEQSIHRVRHTYDAGLHESDGTNRAEIKSAAIALGLNTHALTTDVSPSAALTRLKGQLDAGRVVVLVGEPGKPNAGPTVYERAFNRAYAHAIQGGATLSHSTYDFNGHHAILVLGRDSAGNYVVGDPISEVGFIALTPAEMKDFMTRFAGNRGTGVAVWK